MEGRSLENRLIIATNTWRDRTEEPLPKLPRGEPAAQVQELELRLVDVLCREATAVNAREVADVTWSLVHDRPDADTVKRRLRFWVRQLSLPAPTGATAPPGGGPSGRASSRLGAEAARARREGHQVLRPTSSTSAGTSTDRTTNVSSSTPKAIVKPIWVMTTSGSTARMLKVPARTIPADVITVPVTARARIVPSRVPCRNVSSRARAIRKML
jgi:hypothetical protein